MADGTRRRGSSAKFELLESRLQDKRGKNVAFVSHCLLNENVRYLGGAGAPAAVDAVVDDLRRRGVGIVQMPCPEQRAWGGVLKRRMLRLYGARMARSATGRRILLPALQAWTRYRYNALARGVVRDIADYRDAGYDVTEIIGVGPSPSCGVLTTVELDAALASMGRIDPKLVDTDTVNTQLVAANTTAGRGMFVDALARHLERRGIQVPMREHDLLSEVAVANPSRVVPPR
jgi:predicted secreted protein